MDSSNNLSISNYLYKRPKKTSNISLSRNKINDKDEIKFDIGNKYSKTINLNEGNANIVDNNSYGDNYSTAGSENQMDKDNISIEELKSNIQNVKEYINDILENLVEEEKNQVNITSPNYFNIQNEITPYMRSILIDWIIDIHRQFKFKEETLYIAIYLVDVYLSKKFILKRNLQLLGVTSLLIASKLNDIYLRRISDYSDITFNTYSINEIKEMEEEILKTLNFNLLVPTPLSFYEIISQILGIAVDLDKFKFGEFLMQSFLINNISLNYTSSTIACATCYIIAKLCKMDNYRIIFDNNYCNIKNILFNNKNNYRNEHIIKECAKNICETISEIINSNLNSTVNKYSDNVFYNNIKNNL